MRFTVQSAELEALNGQDVKVGQEVTLPYNAATRRLVADGALAVVEGQRVVNAADPLGDPLAGEASPTSADVEAEAPSERRPRRSAAKRAKSGR